MKKKKSTSEENIKRVRVKGRKEGLLGGKTKNRDAAPSETSE